MDVVESPAAGPFRVATERSIEALASEWDDLADRVRASPWARPGWLSAWYRAFGEGEPEIVVVRDGDRLVGVCPLVRRGAALRSPTNWHTPEFGLLSEDDAAARQLAHSIFARAGGTVSLSFVPRGTRDERELRSAAAQARFHVVERSAISSPYAELAADWPAYERGLSKNLRGDVRRRRRRLEEAGTVDVAVERGEERLDQLLDEGFAVEGSGWKTDRGTAIQSSEETRRFYRDVARWAAGRGALRLCFLRLDGRAIAFFLNLEEDGVVYHLKGGYEPASERFSPGKLLHYALVERAFTSGCTRYEFLGADEPYKLQFATGARELLRLEAFPPTARGVAQRVLAERVRPAAKRVLALRERVGARR